MSLLLLLTPAAAAGTIGLSVSDTVSVAVTEAPVDTQQITTYDSLYVALSESTAATLGTAVSVNRVDFCSVSLSDIATVAISGIVIVTSGTWTADGSLPTADMTWYLADGSILPHDTASVTLVETATVTVSQPVTDTCSVSVSDASTLTVDVLSKNVTDTCSVSVTDLAIFTVYTVTFPLSVTDTLSVTLSSEISSVTTQDRSDVQHITFDPRPDHIKFTL